MGLSVFTIRGELSECLPGNSMNSISVSEWGFHFHYSHSHVSDFGSAAHFSGSY
jgi:hypothetical protein